jgi:hypothetical protein
MAKKYLIVGASLMILITVDFCAYSLYKSYLATKSTAETIPVISQTDAQDYKNATYSIQGVATQLIDGYSAVASTPGSATKVITRYFGNEVRKDLDGDGDEDVLFLVTQETGGSGIFFYAVAALKDNGTYTGSDAIFLGDRVAPQATETGPGRSVIVTYADRAPGESFEVQPSVGKSVRVLLNPETMSLGEWVENFEGESDIETGRMGAPGTPQPPVGKVKADMFTGILEKVDVGCFADGECFVIVDGKHITAIMGWSQEIVGSVQGVAGFGDLESHIGEKVEVYAQEKIDGTYTLYGSEGFYVKTLGGTSGGSEGTADEQKPQVVRDGCMVGGCSGQLCLDAKLEGDMMTTCEYRAEYACHQVATCERQVSGQCGWTMTSGLAQCLSSTANASDALNLEAQ